MFAAGIEFIAEEDEKGVGVRFRERKLEYVGDVKVSRWNRTATLRMKYAGEDFTCVIDLNAVDDYHRANFATDGEFAKAISDMFHTVLATAEHYAPTHTSDGRLLLTYDMLESK